MKPKNATKMRKLNIKFLTILFNIVQFCVRLPSKPDPEFSNGQNLPMADV